MAKEYDFLFRLLMLGDSGVGKTSILRRFTESEFNSSHISTIGIDFKMRTLEIEGVKVRLQIWDTAGQERYQTITKQYYRRAQGIIFVYDITSALSFQRIVKWAGDVDEFAPTVVNRILVGNKIDEESSRQVPQEQGRRLAESYGMDFFETSASSCSNINQAFARIAELVLAAHKADVDNLLGSLDEYLDKAAVEDEESGQRSEHTPRRICWC